MSSLASCFPISFQARSPISLFRRRRSLDVRARCRLMIDHITEAMVLPNEDGTPHHNEEASCVNLDSCADNRDLLTGSDQNGRLCTASTCGGLPITDWSCDDWTSAAKVSSSQPRVGHSWSRGGDVGRDPWINLLNEGGACRDTTSSKPVVRIRTKEPSVLEVATAPSTVSGPTLTEDWLLG